MMFSTEKMNEMVAIAKVTTNLIEGLGLSVHHPKIDNTKFFCFLRDEIKPFIKMEIGTKEYKETLNKLIGIIQKQVS